jgi:hypothetical protein
MRFCFCAFLCDMYSLSHERYIADRTNIFKLSTPSRCEVVNYAAEMRNCSKLSTNGWTKKKTNKQTKNTSTFVSIVRDNRRVSRSAVDLAIKTFPLYILTLDKLIGRTMTEFVLIVEDPRQVGKDPRCVRIFLQRCNKRYFNALCMQSQSMPNPMSYRSRAELILAVR